MDTKTQQQRFSDIVTKAGWRRLKAGENLDPTESATMIVIGVSIWDNSTIDLLSRLAERGKSGAIDTCVFDLDDCKTIADLARFLPSVPPILQTPVVVEYENGRPRRKVEGAEATHWIKERCKSR